MAFSAQTLGVIIGNRDFFPDQLVSEARSEVLALLQARGVTPVGMMAKWSLTLLLSNTFLLGLM